VIFEALGAAPENSFRQHVANDFLRRGGSMVDDETALDKVRMSMDAGSTGVIFGRNVWQRDHDESLRFVARLRGLLERYPSEP
jgi:DhnA family fructose-bisphosphate aldolase class Ia